MLKGGWEIWKDKGKPALIDLCNKEVPGLRGGGGGRSGKREDP